MNYLIWSLFAIAVTIFSIDVFYFVYWWEKSRRSENEEQDDEQSQ